MTWIESPDGKGHFIQCDLCLEHSAGERQVRVGNIVVAELCDKHASELGRRIRGMLATRPGPLLGEKPAWRK